MSEYLNTSLRLYLYFILPHSFWYFKQIRNMMILNCSQPIYFRLGLGHGGNRLRKVLNCFHINMWFFLHYGNMDNDRDSIIVILFPSVLKSSDTNKKRDQTSQALCKMKRSKCTTASNKELTVYYLNATVCLYRCRLCLL